MDHGRYRRSYDDGLVVIEKRTAAAVRHYHHLRVKIVARPLRLPAPFPVCPNGAHQLRQLGEVARHPPSLVHGQHVGDARVVIIVARVEVSERLPIGVDDFEAAGQALDGPWWREAAVAIVGMRVGSEKSLRGFITQKEKASDEVTRPRLAIAREIDAGSDRPALIV